MKIYVHMLAFNCPAMIQGGLQNFHDTVPPDPKIEKTIFELRYPLPNKEQTRREIYDLASLYGWNVQQIENRGVAGNWTQAFDHFNPKDEDVIIGFDPDVRMRGPGNWLQAVADVLEAHPEAPCVIPNRSYHDEKWCYEQHGRKIFTCPKTGHRIATYEKLIAWSMGTHRCDWLRFLREKEGDFKAFNSLYGYSEHWQYEMQLKYGKSWLELVDYYDDHLASGVQYSEWKTESAAGKTTAHFEAWLESRKQTLGS